MGQVQVTFLPEQKTVNAESGETLLEIAGRGGIYIDSLCGGQGVCGKCRLEVRRGRVNFSSKAIGHLDKSELEAGFVLACQATVEDEDVEVWIPPEARKEEEQILMVDQIVRYEEPEYLDEGEVSHAIPYYQPLCRKYYLDLPEPTLEDNVSDLERIMRELRKKGIDSPMTIDYRCLRTLARKLRENAWKVTATIHLLSDDCPRLQALEPGNTCDRNYGVAIDVGTTTIVAQLIDLGSGAIVGIEASHNQQARYGEDVISRMVFACTRNGMDPLKNAVVTTINSLINALVVGAGITHEDITSLVAAGNTTMTHLLMGLLPCHIRLSPYIPTANRFPPVATTEVGIQAHPKAMLHCLPCVSSYVGGDITAGVLACGMSDQPGITALIDVGTNGEIVIGNNQWLVCCSASAGPAFEGGGTKCGMRATKGAVQMVSIDEDRVSYRTVGGAKARGICGSGLIDLIAELAAERIIDQSGKFAKLDHPRVQTVDDVREFVVVPAEKSATERAVVITEDDIGNLIKSKGAVLAAMKILINHLGLSFNDLEKVYVAGGFGAHLNIERSIFLGLLPDIPTERITFIGNSSVAGARLTQLSSHAFRKAETIARQMTYFELSVIPEFMSEFVAALFIPHTDMKLFPTVEAAFAGKRGQSS